MTILSAIPTAHDRDCKAFYLFEIQGHWRAACLGIVSHSRFVAFMFSAFAPLCAALRHCYGPCTGIPRVDETTLAVCRNRRIAQHRVFAGRPPEAKLRWASSSALSSICL
jgi:hypothetical protein